MTGKKAASGALALVFGAIAVQAAVELHHHGVGIGLTVAATIGILNSGLYLALSLIQSARTYRCPVRGCRASIRVCGATPAEHARYQDVATDHTQHGARLTGTEGVGR